MFLYSVLSSSSKPHFSGGWIALATALVFILSFSLSLGAAPSQAQVSLPHTTTDTFGNIFAQSQFIVDLGTLPARPILVAEVVADSAHPDLVAQIRFENYQVHNGPGFLCMELENAVDQSIPTPGSVELRKSLITCDPIAANWAGDTVAVVVRVLNAGASGFPANLEITLRAETIVPFGEELVEFAPTFAQQSVTIPASKDTTLYGRYSSRSNGEGEFIWAGRDHHFSTTYPLNGLLAFDVAGPVPATATVDDVDIVLTVAGTVAGGGTVGIYEVEPDLSPAGEIWTEGTQDALGSEFFPVANGVPGATWNDRLSPFTEWSTAGGDFDPLRLSSKTVTSAGSVSFGSTNLTNVVQGMVQTGLDEEGFILRYLSTSTSDVGVQFRSRQADGPEMVVLFTPTEPYQIMDAPGEELLTGVLSFISEGENFRWIYDLDEDDVLQTEIGGVCTVLPETEDQPSFLPYSYQYAGTSGFTGHDCCTWQIDSPQTGTMGTGQAIFFHNLDPAIPANLPPDTDGDGIRDLCDNCPNTPNGPLLGTCSTGVSAGDLCRSEQECVGGGCSLSQEDMDANFEGDVCLPEPGFAGLLAFGFGWVGMLGRGQNRGAKRNQDE